MSTNFSLGFPACCPAASSAASMLCQFSKSTTCAAQSQLTALCPTQGMRAAKHNTGSSQQIGSRFNARVVIHPMLIDSHRLQHTRSRTCDHCKTHLPGVR